ncbi:hypothetical protein B0H13DRAFT_2069863 [Mycena leptocephala]|nr:hypothetical protein B0H13DRAFT_2069863 [Mycena leptocephala]
MLRTAGYETLPTNAGPSDSQPRNWKKRAIWMLTAAMFSALLGLVQWQTEGEATRLGFRLWSPNKPPKRIYLHVGTVGNEGLGSLLHHFKQSIVLSRALDSSLVLASTESQHGYSSSRIYNGKMHSDRYTVNAYKSCRIANYIAQREREGLVRGVCAGDPKAIAQMRRIKARMASCTSIVDLDVSETTNDLNGCIMGWVRERLTPDMPPLPPLAFPPDRPISVGVHIRWGDTAAHVNRTGPFYGSWELSALQRVLGDLYEAAGPHGVVLRVAMEHADADVLAQLGLGMTSNATYTLLDSGDAFADLRELSYNDVLLLGESSYGVLAHLIAPPGLTIVHLQANLHKYDNTTGFRRNVVYLEDYTPDSLQLMASDSDGVLLASD